MPICTVLQRNEGDQMLPRQWRALEHQLNRGRAGLNGAVTQATSSRIKTRLYTNAGLFMSTLKKGT